MSFAECTVINRRKGDFYNGKKYEYDKSGDAGAGSECS